MMVEVSIERKIEMSKTTQVFARPEGDTSSGGKCFCFERRC